MKNNRRCAACHMSRCMRFFESSQLPCDALKRRVSLRKVANPGLLAFRADFKDWEKVGDLAGGIANRRFLEGKRCQSRENRPKMSGNGQYQSQVWHDLIKGSGFLSARTASFTFFLEKVTCIHTWGTCAPKRVGKRQKHQLVCSKPPLLGLSRVATLYVKANGLQEYPLPAAVGCT